MPAIQRFINALSQQDQPEPIAAPLDMATRNTLALASLAADHGV